MNRSRTTASVRAIVAVGGLATVWGSLGCGGTDEAAVPVGHLDSPHNDSVYVSPGDGARRLVPAEEVAAGSVELARESLVETETSGEVVTTFRDVGRCSVWHNTKIKVVGDDPLFEVVAGDSVKQTLCTVRRPVAVTTAVGRFEVTGTTFGVLLNDDGMGVSIYEGTGVLRAAEGDQAVELLSAQTATARPDGTLSEVAAASMTELDSTRIADLEGEVSPEVIVTHVAVLRAVTLLEVGDCIENLPGGDITELTVVPCSTPHDAEVVRWLSLSGGDDAPYPGRAQLSELVAASCPEGTVGYPPLPSLWSEGFRRALCIRRVND